MSTTAYLSPADARAEFIATTSRISSLRQLQEKLQSATQARFDENLIAKFRERFGKRRKASRSIAWAAFPELAKEMFESAKMRLEDEAAHAGCSPKDVETANERLKELASIAHINPGTEPHLFHQVSAGDFHTQGFGAATYARANAERVCGKVRAHGIRAEIRSSEVKGSESYLSTVYEVLVWVADPVDMMILHLRPEEPLRVVVQRMMKCGANPRVSFPFLPYGYEASVGLDHFGNDLPAQNAAIAPVSIAKVA